MKYTRLSHLLGQSASSARSCVPHFCAAGFLLVTTLGVVQAGSEPCWKHGGFRVCCPTPAPRDCTDPLIPFVWQCTNQSSGAIAIAFAEEAGPGESGKTKTKNTDSGNCTVTVYTCGVTWQDCIEGSTTQSACTSTSPDPNSFNCSVPEKPDR